MSLTLDFSCISFNYDPSFAEHSGLLGYDPSRATPQLDTGVIAQEVRRVLPEAVKEAGDVTLPNGDTIPKFLVVNKVSDLDVVVTSKNGNKIIRVMKIQRPGY